MRKTKKCTKCEVEKPIAEFPWKNREKGKLHAVCKSCTAVRSNKWYYANKEHHVQNVTNHTLENQRKLKDYVNAYLSNTPCAVCGETDRVVLEFDHISGKDNNISDLIRLSVSLPRLRAEIEKCQVLCVNCHKRKTAKERGWYRCRELPGLYVTSVIPSPDQDSLGVNFFHSINR